MAGELFDKDDPSKLPNLVVHQVTGRLPFQLEVAFESGSFTTRGDRLIGSVYDELLDEHRRKFAARFEDKFHLIEKGYSKEDRNFAAAALSNLVGGIGHFYGASKVQSLYNKEVILMYFYKTTW